MIETPTVLILGAGASDPYDFPCGPKLRQIVIGALRAAGQPTYDLVRRLGHSVEEIDSFAFALANSGTESVDAFLEHRTEFLDIGKAAIAQALIPYEKAEALSKGTIRTGNWYNYLFSRMNTPSFTDFFRNELCVLTYNYDRSLEHFLSTSLINLYGKDLEVCAKMVRNNIPIVHLHGSLGHLPWQGSPSREYNSQCTLKAVRLAASSIKIIHEDVHKDPEFGKAHEFLSQAIRVLFLGFGYNPVNVERLQLDKWAVGKSVSGTRKGFTNEESMSLRSEMHGYVKLADDEHDVVEFFRHVVPLE